jgi:hypothetical protein
MYALIFGYPGQGRVPLDQTLGIRPNTTGMRVASTPPTHFLVVDTENDVVATTLQGATPLTNFGGMSGSRVYAKFPDGRFYLTGFMYESSDSNQITYCTYADHINADGTIHDAL